MGLDISLKNFHGIKMDKRTGLHHGGALELQEKRFGGKNFYRGLDTECTNFAEGT